MKRKRYMAKQKGIARVVIEAHLCKGTEGCSLCIQQCQEEVLGVAQTLSPKGVHLAEVLHPERCTGCDLCMLYCPEMAVTVQHLSADHQK